MKPPGICIALIGPTASGKTRLSLELAEQLDAEIVSVDSTCVYRGFDIGSGKPSHQDQARVKHHLVDILAPEEGFSAFHFVQHAEQIIEDIWSRGKLPLVVGGSYFYLRALEHGMYPASVISAEVLEQIEHEFFNDDRLDSSAMHAALARLDAKAAQAIHPNDRYRLVRALALLRTTDNVASCRVPTIDSARRYRWIWLKYAMALPRKVLHQQICDRTDSMLKAGLIEETRNLLEHFPRARALSSIGYAEVVQYLRRQITNNQLRSLILEKTRQLAKRQMTWLRSDRQVRFVDTGDLERMVKDISNLRCALGAGISDAGLIMTNLPPLLEQPCTR